MNRLDGRFAKLRAELAANWTTTEMGDLDDAFEVARHHHAGQKRYSGDPYLSHCLAVAEIVAQHPAPPAWVAAAMAHDLHLAPRGSEGLQLLPGQVRKIVDLTHELSSRRHSVQEITAMRDSELGRAAITIRIADRLHNARTWQYVPREKACLRAADTINRIAPEAARLGLRAASHELRQLSYTMLTQDLPRPHAGSNSRRLLDVATRLTPPAERPRYTYEWLTDLAQHDRDRDKFRLTAGFVVSALMMRASRTAPSQGNGR